MLGWMRSLVGVLVGEDDSIYMGHGRLHYAALIDHDNNNPKSLCWNYRCYLTGVKHYPASTATATATAAPIRCLR